MNRARPRGGKTERRRAVGSPRSTAEPPEVAEPARGGPAIWRRAGVIVIVIAGALTYVNSLSGPFILDDAAAIAGNRTIRTLWHLPAVLFPERDSSVAGRPLVNLSFAINYAIGGLDVRGYHVWNVAMHLLCALVLFGVVRMTLEWPRLRAVVGNRSVNLAFAVSLIWTLHPLNSEVVDYLTQRTESMMALCYLLTLYCSMRSQRPSRESSSNAGHYTRWETSVVNTKWETHVVRRWQIGAVVACFFGMLCKETMVTAPVAVVLYDRCYVYGSFQEAFRARWRFYAALALTWLPLAALIGSGPRAGVVGFSAGVSPWTYLLNQALMLVHYLRLAVWPRSLVVFYGWPVSLALGDVMPAAVLIVCLLLLTLAALVLRPEWGFPAAWFFLTLAPTSTILPITTEVGAERRMYLALAALVALAVVGAVRAWDIVAGRWHVQVPSRTASFSGALTLATVAGALAVGTVARNREYASALDLARTVVDRRPTSVAHHILGVELMAAGRHEEAQAHLREAAGGDSRARFDLGLELFNQGKLDEAIEQLQAYVATWRLPYRLVPHWLEPPIGEVMTARATMARAFGMQRRWKEAAAQAEGVLALVPASVEAHGLLAQALFGQEQFEDAAVQFRKYLEARPDDFGALSSLGIALVAAGRTAEAIPVFRHAVEIDPRSPDARRNLATALYDERQAPEAAVEAEAAVRLKPDDAAAHDLLGRALAVQGRLDEARAQFERAVAIDPGYGDAREDLKRLSTLRGVR